MGERVLISETWYKWRLTVLVGHLLAYGGNFGPHLEHDPLDAAPDRKIATRRGQAINGNGLRHRILSCCVAVE